MIAVDTTVLVYAVGNDHPLRRPCRELIEAIGSGGVQACTTVEVIQEFAHVRAKRRGRADAHALALTFADLLSPLLVSTEAHLRSGLALWGRQQRLGAFDAVLAAAAADAGVRALVSADRAFDGIFGLPHVVPDDSGVSGILADYR